MKTVYIIEDDATLCEALELALKRSIDDLQVVGSSGDGQDGLQECLETAPDLAIVDIRLPEVSGLEILHVIKNRCPDTMVLLYTGYASQQTVDIAVQGRADGFLFKGRAFTEVVDAVREMFSSGNFYCNEVRYAFPHWKPGELTNERQK